MPDNTAWARSIATTIVNHLREEEVDVLRATKLGALIESRGQVTTDLSGLGIDWRVQYRLHPLTAVTGAVPPNFIQQNLWKIAQLETRGYQVTDAITKKEFRENKGTQAIVRVFERMIPRLVTSLKQQFGREFYVDGNATGNQNRIHGIESFMGWTQSLDLTQTSGSEAGRTVSAVDVVAWPNYTYAGLNTNLGDSGGTYTTQPTGSGTNVTAAVASHWPSSDVDPEYDFWSPMIINWNSSSWSSLTQGWKTNCLEVLRFGLLNNQRNENLKGNIDLILIHRNMLKDLLVAMDTNQRTLVTGETGLRAFGFKHVIDFDGAEVGSEYYVPPAVGYGFNIPSVELMSLNPTLFDSEGPIWDTNTQSYKVIADFLGNVKWESPRNFFKLQSLV